MPADMEGGVTISSGLVAELLAMAAAAPDVEICGLLFGTAQAIRDAESCRNVAPAPDRAFELDPAALIAAHRRARAGGPAIIGHYHSHPLGRPEPSRTDAEAAAPDGALWLILAGGAARLWRAGAGGAWHGRFDPLPLIITPPCGAAPPSP